MKQPKFQPKTYFSKTNASIIRSLLVPRGKTGTTLEQLKEDFYNEVGQKIPFNDEGDSKIRLYLECLDNVFSYIRDDTQYYYSSSPEVSHIVAMVEKQKVSKTDDSRFKVPAIPSSSKAVSNSYNKRPKQKSPDSSKSSINENVSKKMRTSSISSSSVKSVFLSSNMKNRTNSKTSSIRSEICSSKIPTLYNGTLVGDQFFLQIAVHNLKFNYTKPYTYSRNKESGYCVSGQTIQEATAKLRAHPPVSKYAMINLGSVDIANGRELIEITMDMIDLVRTCHDINILPVFTTLPPLVNYGFDDRKERLLEFNNYIRLGYFGPYIELEEHFINRENNTLKHLYRPLPQKINGSSRAFVLWSRFGGEMVLRQIKQQLPQSMLGFENNFIVI
ncbi:unnamed protein product [Diamesa tonsa]